MTAHRRALEGRPSSYEGVWRERHFYAHVEPIYDRDRESIGVMGAAIDMTDPGRSEERRQESEERFRRIVESSPDAIVIHEEGVLRFVNPAALKLVGADSAEQVIGRRVVDFVHPDDRVLVQQRMREVMEGGIQPLDLEIRLVRLDGSVAWVDSRGVQHRPRPLEQLVIRDISERRRMEEETRSHVRRLEILHRIDKGVLAARSLEQIARTAIRRMRSLVPYDRAAVSVLDRAGNVTLMAVIGCGRKTLPTGSHYDARDVLGDLQLLRMGRSRLVGDLQQLEPRSQVLREVERLGLRCYVAVPVRARRRLYGAITAWFRQTDVFTDEHVRVMEEVASSLAIAVQEARLLQREQEYAQELQRVVEERTAELAQLNEELDAFAYTAAHDLRAPLRAMRGFGEALAEDYGAELDDTAKEFIGRIVQASEQMDELIGDLLAYSRLVRTEVKLSKVNLGQVVSEVLELLSAEIRTRGAEVKVATPPARVRAYPGILRDVLVNLFTNALKFVPAERRPRIEVWTERHGERVRLHLRDNGIGIASHHKGRIFKLFERLHTRERYPGTGIGLAIVRRGVERMGGSVGVDTTPGKGSVFWVDLEGA